MTGPVLAFLGKSKLELGPAGAVAADGHWRLARDATGIAWLVLDKHGTATNTLSSAVLRELAEQLAEIERDRPRALVVRSAKPAGFVAGADIGELRAAADPAAFEEMLKEGHALFDRLDALACPTIAVLHGYVLGGGFELALACDYRIGIDGVHLGFPEIRLGLHPGLGGTFRLPALIDPVEAMTIMLTGKPAYTAKAKALGILDVVTEERHVAAAVRAAAGGEIEPHGHGLREQAYSLRPARAVAARRMRAKAEEKAPKEHYPAPYRLIDLWDEHGGDRAAMQAGEIASFAGLLQGATAHNLMRAFFLREHLKGLGRGDSGIAHVHVVGAGAMGWEIAAWCAIKGLTATLADVKSEPLATAVRDAARLCDARHLTRLEKRDALDRFIPDPRGAGAARADLVIEAVPEKPDLKRQVYEMLEPKLKEEAILASNTSSLPLEELAGTLADPGRFAGLHFFNPVSKLELVEVVAHPRTDAAVLDRLKAFTAEIDRLPAPVTSAPGFLVNRVLTPYLLEALMLIDEGVSKEAIDRAAERFGMPMGPVEVADQVGLDICLDVADSLRQGLDRPLPDVPAWLREKVDKGELGRKSGQGFYLWQDGKAVKDDVTGEIPDDLADRLVLPMLDACVECLRKGVVANEETVDGAMIFATGFAPFRGGPMHYARTRGVGEIVAALEQLAAAHGERFRPDAGWQHIK